MTIHEIKIQREKYYERIKKGDGEEYSSNLGSPRHTNGANVFFVDGHVAKVSASEWKISGLLMGMGA